MCSNISFIKNSFVMNKVVLLSHMVLGLISEFSELSLSTTIMTLTPASCYYMTSFNYGSKEARDVGLTCRFHLSNVMSNSIFCDSMG